MSFGGFGVFGAGLGVNIGGSGAATENPTAGTTAGIPIGSLTSQILTLLRSLPLSQLSPAQIQFLNQFSPTVLSPGPLTSVPPTTKPAPIAPQPGPGIPVGRVVPVVPQPAPIQPTKVTPVLTDSLMKSETPLGNTLTIPQKFRPGGGAPLFLPGPYEAGSLMTRVTAPIQQRILKHAPRILESVGPSPVRGGIKLIRAQVAKRKAQRGSKTCDCEAIIAQLCACDCASQVKGAKPARGRKPGAARKPHVVPGRLPKRVARAKTPTARRRGGTPLQKINRLIHQHGDLTSQEKTGLRQLAHQAGRRRLPPPSQAHQKALDDCLKRLQDLEQLYG